MSDAIAGFFLKPIVYLLDFLEFSIGIVVILLPLIYILAVKGKRSISKFPDLFSFCASIPLGKAVFSGIVGFSAPYSASIGGRVDKLTRNTCEVYIRERPWLRNPFKSVHALALANLGELCSGLLMMSNLQYHKNIVGIPVRIDTEYFKKARGVITGRCSIEDSVFLKLAADDAKASAAGALEEVVETHLFDSKGVLVATTKVYWSMKRKDDKKKKK